MHTQTNAEIAVWEANGVPVRLVWGGQRWKVIDTPTRLVGDLDWLPPMITHPPEPRPGWRFMARAARTDEVLTFDITKAGAGWLVRDIWD